jgi:hypothetical protein
MYSYKSRQTEYIYPDSQMISRHKYRECPGTRTVYIQIHRRRISKHSEDIQISRHTGKKTRHTAECFPLRKRIFSHTEWAAGAAAPLNPDMSCEDSTHLCVNHNGAAVDVEYAPAA